MSDSGRCSSADSENRREIFTKFYLRQGAASKMFRDTSATMHTMQCQAMLISHFELHILPKVSKTVGILAKTLKNVFLVQKFIQRSEFADFREINRAKT